MEKICVFNFILSIFKVSPPYLSQVGNEEDYLLWAELQRLTGVSETALENCIFS